MIPKDLYLVARDISQSNHHCLICHKRQLLNEKARGENFILLVIVRSLVMFFGGLFIFISINIFNDDNVSNDQLLIESFRIDSVPGTHTVIYDSEVDSIEFKHTAHNRNGFALGAVLAAEWVANKKGFFSAEEMFDFGI